jgi:hypothetical protein
MSVRVEIATRSLHPLQQFELPPLYLRKHHHESPRREKEADAHTHTQHPHHFELQWYGCIFDDALAACVQNRKTDLYLESLPAGSAESLCNVEPDKCTTDVPPKLKAYQCVNYHPRDCVEKSKDLVFFPGEAITDYFDCVKLTCSKCIYSQVQLLTPMHAVDSQPRARNTCKRRVCVAGVRDTSAQRMYVCYGN